MNLITLENISKSYSEKILSNNVSLGINEGEKIGLIGVNGTGKSSFLKIVAGVEEPDEGTVTKGNRVRIEYLAQTEWFWKINKASRKNRCFKSLGYGKWSKECFN